MSGCSHRNEGCKSTELAQFTPDAVHTKDDTKCGGIIKNFNGSPDDNAPNEAIKYKGKIITSNKKKSAIFIQHHADVSKLKFTPEERAVTRRLKKILGSSSGKCSKCTPFKIEELELAISKMRKGGSGARRRSTNILKNLGSDSKNRTASHLQCILQTSHSAPNVEKCDHYPLTKTRETCQRPSVLPSN